MRTIALSVYVLVASMAMTDLAMAQADTPKGEIKGTAFVHSAQSAKDVMLNASVGLPEAVTHGPAYFGPWKDMPRTAGDPVPVVVFLHGSSGLSLKAIGEWQKWLSSLGIASVAPDSFALADRVTYTSPIAKDIYERIHALRSSEIPLAAAALKGAAWADQSRIVLAGASEGGPAVARNDGSEFAARIIYAWSCEDNYFVDAHGTRVIVEQPVLNVISATDPFFSRSNAWLGNTSANGHCAAALREAKHATVVLVPQAPHTLINLPQARAVTRSFLEDALKR
ncbi:MAG: alpha/beta hydrolase [Reyranellales bacterium]